MREEHPIDEQFGALYHAESTPPDAVRQALAARLGWSGAATGGFAWRPLLIAVIGLCLVGGTAGYLMQIGPEGPRAIAEGSTPEGKEATHSHSNATSSEATGSTSPPAEVPLADADLRSDQGAATPNAGKPTDRSVVAANAADQTIDEVHGHTHGTSPRGVLATRPQNKGVMPAVSGSDGEVLTQMIGAPAVFGAERAEWLDPHPVRPDPSMEEAVPARSRLTDYVLPGAWWWVGAFAGTGSVNGQWKGQGAGALSAAEEWSTTAQGGVLVGRSWRSGWGVSGGLGVAQVRSQFDHTAEGEGVPVLEVDTNWTSRPYQDSPYTLFTWTIDSVAGTQPGPAHQYQANNMYNAVLIPLTGSWHGTVRRFHFGAFGGVEVWIPTKRKGLTLAPASAEAQPVPTDLQDPEVDTRFEPQLHGRTGVGVGYSITELFSVHAEPTLTMPLLTSPTGPSPWTTRTVLQLRLQYELR